MFFNIYGRRLPDQEEIARNLIQLADEDQGRLRRLAIRARGGGGSLFALGACHPRWWVSPVCFSGVMVIGFWMRDWSWRVLDVVLTRIGFF